MRRTVKKLWVLDLPKATEADATYLFSLGCTVEVIVPEYNHFTTANGTRVAYCAEKPRIEIETSCEKQESMLYLKYSDLLHLKMIKHDPVSMTHEEI
jgi:hypothetical protein